MKLLEKDKDGIMNSQLQWQLNLLTHVESLQDEVTHRMDLIEKELDGNGFFLLQMLRVCKVCSIIFVCVFYFLH